MDQIVKNIPKAELHVHIEGTITPGMARRLAKKNGITLPDDIFTPDGRKFTWKDFSDCVTRVYDAMAQVVQSKEDYKEITLDYLRRCAAEGSIYEELIISPDHGELVGVTYEDMVTGMAEAIDQARDETGIEARMNVTLVRHLPMDKIKETVKTIIAHPHPYVTGVDLAGAETEGDIPKFIPLLDEIHEKVDGITGSRLHAVEGAGPRNGWDSLKLNPPPTRWGHGVRVIEDPVLMKEIIKRGITLEVAPTSNVLAGIFPSYATHPLKKLVDAGVKVSLNSDDPGLFGNSIGMEYQVAKDEFALTAQQLRDITRTAIEAAFVDEPTRQKLLKKVDSPDFFKGSRPQTGPENNGPTPPGL